MDDPWACDPTADDAYLGDPYYDDPTLADPSWDDPAMADPYWDEPGYDDPYWDDPAMADPYWDEPGYDDPTLDNPWVDPSYDDPVTGGPWMGDPLAVDDVDLDLDFGFDDPPGAPGSDPSLGSAPTRSGGATTRSFDHADFELAEFDLDESDQALTRSGDALEPTTIIDLALTTTAHELAHLAALDAFGDPLDADARAIVDQVDLVPAPRLVAVPALVELDEFGARVLAAMEDAGLDASPAVRQTLSTLSETQLEAIERAGAAPGLDPARYVRAYELLATTWDELQPERDTPPTDVETPDDLAFADDTEQGGTVDETTRPGPADTESDGAPAGGMTGGLVVGGLIAVVLVLAGLATRWWHARRSDSSGAAVADLVEVSRLLNGARTEAEVGRIVVEEASRITSGEAALFSGRSVGALAEIAASAAFPAEPVLAAAELARVLDLATPGTFAVDGLDVVAVPVIESGIVGGVLLATGPLTSEQRREQNLRRLASIAGASLAAARRQRELEDLSSIDALTGLANRRRLDEDLATALEAHEAMPVSFAMIDVDHFKTYNDTHGHAAGDLALATVARVLRDVVGSSGTAYRYGGEEFCVLGPATGSERAAEIGEVIRAAIEAEAFPGGDSQPGGRVTVSVGVATTNGGDVSDLVEAADQALYSAKRGGRNAVVVAETATH